MELLLAIDGGGSRTRCLAFDRGGKIRGHGESGASNHLQTGPETAQRSLADAIHQALAGHPGASVVCVSAGLAGVDYDGAGAHDAAIMFRDIGYDCVAIHGDMVIAHYGAFAGRPGVLTLAGTGSVVLGIGPAGDRVKVNGWGPMYGDEGSAYWIGRMGLAAAARASDGRGSRTKLLDELCKALGIEEFAVSISRVYGERPMQPREVAALCPAVCRVAESDDDIALSILRRAGEELADGALAAIRRLALESGACRVACQGSVFERCARVRMRFEEVLRERCLGVEIVPAASEPVIGAYLLGCKAIGWQPRYEVNT